MGETSTETALVALNRNGTRKGHGRLVPVATLRRFLVLNDTDLPGTQIANQLHVAKSTVDRWRSFIKKGKFDAYIEKSKRLSRGQSSQTHSIIHRPTIIERTLRKPRKTFPPFVKKIVRYHDNGMSGREMAAKLHISTGQIYYWLAKMNGGSAKKSGFQNPKPRKGDTNGIKNPFNKNILLGIAYAETERFFTNISERIKIPPQVLRRRLPELLAASSLRE
jgi:transposase